MKIHRLSISNLNSLYGETQIDLDEVLQGESLFLISGPTGSGKSTLMDAISLAFFGRTPRLDRAKNKQDQRPEAIMSRGTGACRSSVEFSKLEGGSRRHYRATWTCRRAHGKPGAHLQDPDRSMEALQVDGSWEMLVSSRKSKDFAPVFRKVFEGFDVMDFNRSMLLAQGQFDAFLKASPEERAKILERLTDTSIYKQIGERAARIRGRHSEKIKSLRTLAAAVGGMDPESLQKLEADHAQHRKSLAAAQKCRDAAQTRVHWVLEWKKCLQNLQEVRSDQALLKTEKTEAEEALALLERHEQCEIPQAFAQLDILDQVEAAGLRIADHKTTLEQKAPQLGESLEKAEENLKLRHQQAHTLAEQMEKLRPRVQAQLDSEGAVQRSAQRVHKIEEEQSALTSELETLKKTLIQAQADLRTARQVMTAARQHMEAEPIQTTEILLQNLEQARTRERDLQEAISPVQLARSSAASLTLQVHQIRDLKTLIDREGQALLPKEEDLKIRTEQALQAAQALQRERRIAQLVVHRTDLVNGEPCPLCGAPEHPWSHDEERARADQLIQQIIEEAERIERKAERSRGTAQADVETAKRKLGDHQAGLALLTQNQTKSTSQQATLDLKAGQSLTRLGLATDLGIDRLRETATEAQVAAQSAQTRLDAYHKIERKIRESLARIETLEATQKGCQKMHGHQVDRQAQLQTLEIQQQALALKDLETHRLACESLDHIWSQILDLLPTQAAVVSSSPANACLETLNAWSMDAQDTLSQARTAQQSAHTSLEKHKSAVKILETQRQENTTSAQAVQADMKALLAQLSLADTAALRERRLSPDPLREYRRLRLDLQTRSTNIVARQDERETVLKTHMQDRPQDLPSDPSLEELEVGYAKAQEQLAVAQQIHQESTDALRDHAKAETDRAAYRADLETAEEKARVWESLHQAIGVQEGGRFQQFAQALNLSTLLDKANVHLKRLSDRYLLISREADGLPTLNFDLADLHQAGARVTTRSLSGGERFLVSLALALGLSDFRAIQMPIETLLLDEGFGTLDSETLELALSALSQLQADGRQVGIISHVAGLREQIPARIEVQRLGGGRSRVLTP